MPEPTLFLTPNASRNRTSALSSSDVVKHGAVRQVAGEKNLAWEILAKTTNYVVNPRFHSSYLHRWFTPNSVAAVISTNAVLNGRSVPAGRVVQGTSGISYIHAQSATVSSTQNETWAAHVWIKNEASVGVKFEVGVRLRGSGDAVDLQTVVVPANSWHRFETSGITSNGHTVAQFFIQFTSSANDTFLIAEPMLEKFDTYHEYTSPYCDGTMGTGYSWQGTAHDSPSVREGAHIDLLSQLDTVNPARGTIAVKWRKVVDTTFNNYVTWIGEHGGTASDWFALNTTGLNHRVMSRKGDTNNSYQDYPTRIAVGEWETWVVRWDGTSWSSKVNDGSWYYRTLANALSTLSGMFTLGGVSDYLTVNGQIEAFAVFDEPLSDDHVDRIVGLDQAWTWENIQHTDKTIVSPYQSRDDNGTFVPSEIAGPLETTGTNLVPDPLFSQGTGDWLTTRMNVSVDEDQVYEGAPSLKLVRASTDGSSYAYNHTQNWVLQEGDTRTVRAMVKADKDDAHVQIWAYTSSGVWIDSHASPPIPVSTEWTEVTWTAPPASAGAHRGAFGITLSSGVNSVVGDTAWIAQPQMEIGDTLTPFHKSLPRWDVYPATTNLATNPTPTSNSNGWSSWTTTGSSMLRERVQHQGTWAQKTTVTTKGAPTHTFLNYYQETNPNVTSGNFTGSITVDVSRQMTANVFLRFGFSTGGNQDFTGEHVTLQAGVPTRLVTPVGTPDPSRTLTSITIFVSFGSADLQVGDAVWAWDAQIENRHYATPFVNGSHSGQNLYVPTAGRLNSSSGAVVGSAQTVQGTASYVWLGSGGSGPSNPVDSASFNCTIYDNELRVTAGRQPTQYIPVEGLDPLQHNRVGLSWMTVSSSTLFRVFVNGTRVHSFYGDAPTTWAHHHRLYLRATATNAHTRYEGLILSNEFLSDSSMRALTTVDAPWTWANALNPQYSPSVELSGSGLVQALSYPIDPQAKASTSLTSTVPVQATTSPLDLALKATLEALSADASAASHAITLQIPAISVFEKYAQAAAKSGFIAPRIGGLMRVDSPEPEKAVNAIPTLKITPEESRDRHGAVNPTVTGGVIEVEGEHGKAWQVAEATENLVRNPRGERGTAYWNRVQTEQKSVPQEAYEGEQAFKVTATTTASWSTSTLVDFAGTHLSVQSLIKADTDTVGKRLCFYVQFRDSSGSVIGPTQYSDPIELPDEWQRVTYAGLEAPEGAESIRVGFYSVSGENRVEDGDSFYFTRFQAEAKAYCTPYCDGDLGQGHSWTGTPHASSSTRDFGRVSFPITPRDEGSIVIRYTPFDVSGKTNAPHVLYGGGFTLVRSSAMSYYSWAAGGGAAARDNLTPDFSTQDITLTWKDGIKRILINGEELASEAFTDPIPAGSSLATGAYGPYSGDGLFHAILTFDRAITESDSKALFESETWEWDEMYPRIGGVQRTLTPEPITATRIVPEPTPTVGIVPTLSLSPDASRDRQGEVEPVLTNSVRVVDGEYGKAWQVLEETVNHFIDPLGDNPTNYKSNVANRVRVNEDVQHPDGVVIPQFARLTATSTNGTLVLCTAPTLPHNQGDFVSNQLLVRGRGSTIGKMFRITVREYGGASGSRAPQSELIPLTSDWQKLTVTAQVQQPDRDGIAMDGILSNCEEGDQIDVIAAQMESKPYTTPFVHGDMGRGFGWTGTPHASSSVRTNGYVQLTANGVSTVRGSMLVKFRQHDASGINKYAAAVGELGIAGRDFFGLSTMNAGAGTLFTRSGTLPQQSRPLSYPELPLGEWTYQYIEWDGRHIAVSVNGSELQSFVRDEPIGNTDPIVWVGSRGAWQLNGEVENVTTFDRPLTQEERERVLSLNRWEWNNFLPSVGGLARVQLPDIV